MPQETRQEITYSFGPYRLVPEKQLLTWKDHPVRLGGRAIDVLTALVERAGNVVSRDDLMGRAWPSTFVEASNLKVTVATIRRVLERSEPGRRYIATVNGRGYRFVETVHTVAVTAPLEGRRHNLPALSRVIGRGDETARVSALLGSRSIVTIKGTGGVGKTSLALAVAQHAFPNYPDGLWVLDLSAVEDGRYAASALAQQIGLTIQSDDPATALAAAMRGWHALIILDGCENALEETARLCRRLVDASADIAILATSREPLRVAGESVVHLGPLGVPPSDMLPNETDALRFPAVELFIERASASFHGEQPGPAVIAAIVAICRRLEGLPLALELAATRLEGLSAADLLRDLNERFDLLDRGPRGGPARHQSLSATLDWSHDLLGPSEQTLFRRLAVLHGSFSLASAQAVGETHGSAEFDLLATLADLVSKSMIARSNVDAEAQYRYLDTTRTYALGKLRASGELGNVFRHYAEHCRTLCQNALAEWPTRPDAAFRTRVVLIADNVRAALTWAFADGGDPALGIFLTAAAIPLWDKLSFVQELIESAERALAGARKGTEADTHHIMVLCASLAAALLQAKGPVPRVEALWRRSLQCAEQLGDAQGRIRALWGLCDVQTWTGDHRAALDLIGQIRAVATAASDRAALVAVDRPAATAHRYLGDLDAARHAAERLLFRPSGRTSEAAAQVEGHVTVAARGALANVLWLQGYSQRATGAAQRALTDAQESGRAFALTNALAHTLIPIALHVGDLAAAERGLALLSDHVARHALRIWHAISDCLAGIHALAQGEPAGLGRLRDGLDDLHKAGVGMRRPAYLGSLASGLGAHGHRADALETIEEALSLSARGGEVWCRPELLRIKGELLVPATGAGEQESARACFREAVDLAEQQGASIWVLRSATSLAASDWGSAEAESSHTFLASVLARFTEGFDTPDLTRARSQLARGGAENRSVWPVALA